MKGKRVKVDDRKVRYGNKKKYHLPFTDRILCSSSGCNLNRGVHSNPLCAGELLFSLLQPLFLLYCAVNHRGLILANHLSQTPCWEMDFRLGPANGWCWEEPGGRKREDSRVLLLSLTQRLPLLPTASSHRPRWVTVPPGLQ